MAEKQVTESTSALISEYRLLNALYLNPDKLDEPGISEELFIHGSSKSIYKALQYLKEQNTPNTELAVFQYASGIDVNVSLNTISEIAALNQDKDVDIKDMVESLLYMKNSEKALKIMSEVESLINKHPRREEAVEELIRKKMLEAESLLLEGVSIKRTSTMEELKEQYLEDFNLRKNGKRYKFYDPVLDKSVTYGPNPGNGGLITAATGMGKSAYCLNLINGLANAGVPCLLYTLEMGNVDTTDRLMALRTGIPVSQFVNPEDPSTWLSLRDKIESEFKELIDNSKFEISECASVSLQQIRQDALKFQKKIGQKYFILFVDLLSMVREFMITDSKGANFAQGITVAVNVMNAMAKELGFHWIGTLQIGRKAEDGRIDDIKDIDKFRPKRTDIKDSNSYLERARWSVYLFRKKYYAENYLPKELWEDMLDIVEVGMMKQNQGRVGMIGAYMFQPECMRMQQYELDDEEETDEKAS